MAREELPEAHKRVYHSNSAIKPIVLKILGENFREAVVFRV